MKQISKNLRVLKIRDENPRRGIDHFECHGASPTALQK